MTFRLTTIATFRTPTSAWMARNYLSALGIRAFVIDEHIATAIWTWGNAIGWTKLQVELESEQAALEALKRRRETCDLLMAECEKGKSPDPKGRGLLPPCMDRKPVTAAEGVERRMNEREDLVRRAKLAAVFAFIMLGNAIGLPSQWERLLGLSSGIFVEVAGLGLMGYSTWLLWAASTSQESLRPIFQADLFWGRCMNAIMYSLLALIVLHFASLSR